MAEKLTEADTCRKFVTPRLIDAGWDTDPHSIAEQWPLTDGRIVLLGGKPQRMRQRPSQPEVLPLPRRFEQLHFLFKPVGAVPIRCLFRGLNCSN